MSADSKIQTGLHALIESIDVPPVPLQQIRERMPHVRMPLEKPREHRFATAVAVAAAALISIVPLVSPAVMQGIEARYRAALQALGGIAPPPAPANVLAQLKPQSATLKSAQSRVPFTIVPPSGLPKGAVLSKIVTTPTGVLNNRTHSWSIGPSQVTLAYRRKDGREFVLVANSYDPRGERPGKYMFEAKGVTPDGRPILVKHRRFAWRNGDQEMLATEGAGLSAPEILSIQAAMHGAPVPLRELHAPDHARTTTLRVIVHP